MPRLNVEHFACNVSDPVAMAAWYVEHLGMRVVRRVDSPQHIHFMADANGRVVIEIYNNTADPIPHRVRGRRSGRDQERAGGRRRDVRRGTEGPGRLTASDVAGPVGTSAPTGEARNAAHGDDLAAEFTHLL